MAAIALKEGITTEHLGQIYADPYITKVGHDHRPAAPIQHPLVTYLSAFVNGKFAGAFIAIQQTAIEIDLHALLKKEFVRYSRMLGAELLRWSFDKKQTMRVTAYIIEGLESAKNYCIKLGFKMEGFRRDACMQDGNLKGVHILGMTRRDWSLL